jgi:F-type H+-transporting ATPase subunit b
LIKAEEERQAAINRLTAAEAKLAQLETEKQSILAKARQEAEFEKNRLAEHTRLEAERLRQQAEAELARVQNQSRVELRRYSAEESIRLAEQKLRAQIDGTADARLVRASIQEIGGLN